MALFRCGACGGALEDTVEAAGIFCVGVFESICSSEHSLSMKQLY